MSRYSSRARPSEEDQPLLASELGDSSSLFNHPHQHHIELDDLAVPQYDNNLDPDSQFGGPRAREELEKKLLRKLDLRMSILVVIYVLNYIDRNSAAAARLRGFEDDLGLEGTQYASIISVLYLGYLFMQIPSNMFLSQIDKPSLYLPSCMMVWGAISFFTGFTTSYYGALFARFLLGFVEAAFFPGALFLIAKWYKRNELSQRTAFLTCGSLFSNAFGSLIASGILDMMDGVLGYTAWRWLFFVEGGLTMLVAFLALFILPDFPETKSMSWLTPAEHALARQRMIEDAAGMSYLKPSGDTDEPLKPREGAFAGLMIALADWKCWYLAVTLFLAVTSLSFHLYFPTLTSTMGYNPTISLLLCAPPWLVATAWGLWFSRHSDRTGDRCMHVVIPFAIGIAGFLLAMSTMNLVVRYISLFLMAQMFAGFICFLAWTSAIVSNPPAKRAVAIAFINSISQSGNIGGSYVWPKSWGPTYNKSYAACIAAALLCIIMCLRLRKTLGRLNKEMDLAEEGNDEGVGSGGKGWRYQL